MQKVLFCRMCLILFGCWATFTELTAGTITWTNVNGGSWSTPANWNPNTVPSSTDDARIVLPGNYRVILEPTANGLQPDVQVATLVLGADTGTGIQTLSITNRSFIANSIKVVGKGSLQADGQSLSIQGPTTVADGGTFNLATRLRSTGGLVSATSVRLNPLVITNGGTVNATSESPLFSSFTDPVVVAKGGLLRSTKAAYQRLTVGTGGVVDFTGDFSIGSVSGPGFLTNSGVINFTNASGALGETVVNNSGALLNLQGLTTVSAGTLVNAGAVTSRTTSEISISLNQWVNTSGLVTNSAGILKLNPPGKTIVGAFGAAVGSTIQFVGRDEPTNTVTLGSPLSLSGSGQFQFVGGRLRVEQNLPSQLTLKSGILELAPAFQGGAITNLTLDGMTLGNSLPLAGQLRVNGGRLDASFPIHTGGVLTLRKTLLSGALRVNSGGRLEVIEALELLGSVTNSGTFILSNVTAKIAVRSQAGILNQPAGLVQCFGSNDLRYADAGNFFINQGRLLQSSGPGTSLNVAQFDNASGTVSNLAGLLRLSNVRNTRRGAFHAAAGATNQLFTGQKFFGGDNNENAPISPGSPLQFTGPGAHQLLSGLLTLTTTSIPNLQLVGGTVALAPTFQGGQITNLTLHGAILTQSLPVRGQFNILDSPIASELTIAAGGTVNAGPNGQFARSVTINPGGQLNILGTFNLAAPLLNSGTLRLQPAPPSADFPPDFGTILFVSHNGTTTSGSVVNESVGTIEFASDMTGLFDADFTGGKSYLLNRGQIVKTTDGFSTLGLAFQTNAGIISVQRGLMQLNPSLLRSTSQLSVRLNSNTDYGQFEFFGQQNLAGTFNAQLASGFSPASGATFNVLAYGERQGSFSSLNLPSAVTWQRTFGPTNLTLTVTGGGLPLLSAPERIGTNLVFQSQGGKPGGSYSILTTTNLGVPLASWTVLRTGTYDTQGRLFVTNGISTATRARFFLLSTP